MSENKNFSSSINRSEDVEDSIQNSSDLALSGSVQVLGLLGTVTMGAPAIAFGALSAGASVLIGAYQAEQQKKFLRQVSQELENIDKAKLDKKILESSEFKEIVIRICQESILISSERKHKALARGLLNSALHSENPKSQKLAYIRIVSQLSDNELVALELMQSA